MATGGGREPIRNCCRFVFHNVLIFLVNNFSIHQRLYLWHLLSSLCVAAFICGSCSRLYLYLSLLNDLTL